MADSDKKKGGKAEGKGKGPGKPKSSTPVSSSKNPLITVSDPQSKVSFSVPFSAPDDLPSGSQPRASAPKAAGSTSAAAPESSALVSTLISSLLPEIRSLVREEMSRPDAVASTVPRPGVSDIHSLASLLSLDPAVSLSALDQTAGHRDLGGLSQPGPSSSLPDLHSLPTTCGSVTVHVPPGTRSQQGWCSQQPFTAAALPFIGGRGSPARAQATVTSGSSFALFQQSSATVGLPAPAGSSDSSVSAQTTVTSGLNHALPQQPFPAAVLSGGRGHSSSAQATVTSGLTQGHSGHSACAQATVTPGLSQGHSGHSSSAQATVTPGLTEGHPYGVPGVSPHSAQQQGWYSAAVSAAFPAPPGLASSLPMTLGHTGFLPQVSHQPPHTSVLGSADASRPSASVFDLAHPLSQDTSLVDLQRDGRQFSGPSAQRPFVDSDGFAPPPSFVASDARSLDDEQTLSGAPANFKVALEAAAEVTSRYFPEGATASAMPSAAAPSAMADFRLAKEEDSYFRFLESPSVAFQFSRLFAKGTTSGGGLPSAPVPLLVPHGSAPEPALEYLASPAQASSFVPLAAQRKLPMPKLSRNLLSLFALPRAPLQVTPELLPLLTKPLKKESCLPLSEQTLSASEEVGRQLLELSSISETLLRALSRALTESLAPFTLSTEQDAEDICTLLSTLARVNEEQMRLSSLHYTHAVMCRRDLFLAHSQFTEESTRNTLRSSPLVEGSLFGHLASDARKQEIESNRDTQFSSFALQNLKQQKQAAPKQAQSKQTKTSAQPHPASRKRPHAPSRGSGKRSSSGRGRGAPQGKPHPQ
ncbi:uncharacterized protein [Littorina saxatilis]|uniref:uncharacterized protein n=1 Tax=Littorina saxatilis TaxID=31220 RepID=UPI0038B58F1D